MILKVLFRSLVNSRFRLHTQMLLRIMENLLVNILDSLVQKEKQLLLAILIPRKEQLEL